MLLFLSSKAFYFAKHTSVTCERTFWSDCVEMDLRTTEPPGDRKSRTDRRNRRSFVSFISHCCFSTLPGNGSRARIHRARLFVLLRHLWSYHSTSRNRRDSHQRHSWGTTPAEKSSLVEFKRRGIRPYQKIAATCSATAPTPPHPALRVPPSTSVTSYWRWLFLRKAQTSVGHLGCRATRGSTKFEHPPPLSGPERRRVICRRHLLC